MYEFALCAHPASHLLYSRTPNMYMYRYVLYIHHTYMYLSCAHNSPLTYTTYIKYVYGYIHVQNTHHVHHTYVYLPCASTQPLTMHTLVCQICVWKMWSEVRCSHKANTHVYDVYDVVCPISGLSCVSDILLQHTATHCNTLQHIATFCITCQTCGLSCVSDILL